MQLISLKKMNTFLLTWNPRRSPNEDLIEVAVALKPGRWVRNRRWSCGNNKNIKVGGRVFLLRQGNITPGIVASGQVVRGSFQALSWDAKKRRRGLKSWFVRVDWDHLLIPEHGLPRAELLNRILPDTLLKSAASGVRVPEELTNRLERSWDLHLKRLNKISRHLTENRNPEKSYWVVSPNVRNIEATVGAWRQASVIGRGAFMGWYPNEGQMGPAFAGKTKNGIKSGDVILIARRHRLKPEIVGFGMVRGDFAKRVVGLKTPDTFGSFRRLQPFIPWTGLPPRNVPIMEGLRHTRALVQLHPDWNDAHKTICNWLDQQINKCLAALKQGARSAASRPEPRGSDTKIVSSPENHQLDYKVQTRAKVIQARKVEALLLEAYRKCIAEQGRNILAVKYKNIQCDAYDLERHNLIEAKSSARREHIRMAVGQLLDYAFQGKVKLGDPNKAILLPSKPKSEILDWLESLKIKTIWREKEAFVDNSNGQFT